MEELHETLTNVQVSINNNS